MSALNKVSYQIIAYEDTIQETPNKKKPNPYQTLLGVQYRLGLVTRRRVEACTLPHPEFSQKTPESVVIWHFFLDF